jgi:hypothetical protein
MGYKFNDERQALYLTYIERGYGRHEAAKASDLRPQTVWENYRKHPEFKTQIEEAELRHAEEQVGHVEDALYRSCVEDRNTTAIIFFLVNRAPARWMDKRNRAEITVNATDQNPEAIRAKLKQLGLISEIAPLARVDKDGEGVSVLKGLSDAQ